MMRFLSILSCFIFISFGYSQNPENKDDILKITYVATPQSQYQSLPSDSPKYDPNSSALAQAHKHYYTLYIDLKSQKSLYKLDSLSMGKKPSGYENHVLMIQDSIDFVAKISPTDFIKYEKVFQREFYSQGKINDIQWKITDKEKDIYGLKCKKAVPKDDTLLMNVWYTTDVAVSSGPSYFLNLPGLVVRAEDFFWTTEIDDIQYVSRDVMNLEDKINKKQEEFKKNRGGNFIAEKKFILLKKKLIESMMRMM